MATKSSDEYPLKVAFYLRVSTEDQAEKYGIDLQKEALLGLIKSKGKLKDGVTDAMMLAGKEYIYIDDGISGTKDMEERPAFAKIKEDIINSGDNKPFDAVMVYKIDRFARRLKVLLDIIDFFDDYDIKFISATESLDTSTPFGKAMIGIIGVIAELELENIKARTKGGKESAKRLGTFTGTAPFGYKKNIEKRLEILNDEAKTVRMIFEMFIEQKMTLQEIASYLTKNEYLSPEASAMHYKKRKKGDVRKKNSHCFWRGDKVGKLLSDEVYLGRYYYNKNEGGKKLLKDKWLLSEHKHEAIIDPITFEKARNRLISVKKYLPKSTNIEHVYTLRGLLRCDACKDGKKMMNWIGGRKMIDKNINKFTYSYQCGKKNVAKTSHVCTTIPFPADEIEEYIINFIRRLLDNPEAVYKYQKQLKSASLEIKYLERDHKHLQKLLESLPKKRENILEQHKNSYIGTQRLNEEMAKLKLNESEYDKQLTELERRMAESSLSNNYIKVFAELDKKYKQALAKTVSNREEVSKLLHMLIEDIIVYSRPVCDDDIIAGRRKEDQKIPYKIEIKFKLPQDILEDLIKDKAGDDWGNGPGEMIDENGSTPIPVSINSGFGVKSSVVSPGWESDPPKQFCRLLYNRFTTGTSC